MRWITIPFLPPIRPKRADKSACEGTVMKAMGRLLPTGSPSRHFPAVRYLALVYETDYGAAHDVSFMAMACCREPVIQHTPHRPLKARVV